MQVKDIMTAGPACCTPDTSLREVSQMMVDNDCGSIPVIENTETMKLVGVVTDRISSARRGRRAESLRDEYRRLYV